MKMKIFTGTPSPKISHDRISQENERSDLKEANPSQISGAVQGEITETLKTDDYSQFSAKRKKQTW